MALSAPVKMYQHRGHVIETAPAAEPVTATELRDALKETATSLPDATANDLIATAREYLEELTGLAMITQSWKLALDRWPTTGREPWWDGVRQGSISELFGAENEADLPLPRYPLQSVDTVTVYNEAGTGTAVTIASVFDVDTYGKPGRMALKAGATWPVALRPTNAIEIVYTSGYGAAGSAVPAPLKRAVKNMAAYLYAHPGDGCEAAAIETGAKAYIGAYQVARL